MSVVVEIGELVSPLCYYAQRVFEEGHHNQESANCWYVSVGGRCQLESLWRAARYTSRATTSDVVADSRLQRFRPAVQNVLNFACLHPQLVQWTRIVPRLVAAPSIAERALVAQMIASGAAYLRHGGRKVCERREVVALRSCVLSTSSGVSTV